MNSDNKITVIEGPPPVFEQTNEEWAQAIQESPALFNVVLTRLRTFNGPALVERCHRTWRNFGTMFLEYRASDGLVRQTPILAARYLETPEGHLLLLWVRLPKEEIAYQMGADDDPGSNDPESSL